MLLNVLPTPSSLTCKFCASKICGMKLLEMLTIIHPSLSDSCTKLARTKPGRCKDYEHKAKLSE